MNVNPNMPDQPPSGTEPQSDTAPSVMIGASRSDDTLTGTARSASGVVPFTHLGHYEVVGFIGHGGMGDVYRGYERALDRNVALKVLPADLSKEPEFVRRFYAEASAAARVVHPHVIRIHFIGEDAGRHFFAMQYVDGESLAALLARRGRLSVEETLDLLEQVLSGLGAAHRQGLIHRDIKPGNILLDRVLERALVADFGLVKSLAAIGQTATGVVMGTVDYIAPEQGRGQSVDNRCDLYALGVLAYQLLSGRLPFLADSPTALIFQHVYEPPPHLGDHVPRSLAAVVAKLMAKSRELRHTSAEAVLADLQAVRSGLPLPSGADLELAANPQAFLKAATPVADSSVSTRIIRAPSFANEPWLSDEQLSATGTKWWSQLKRRWSDWLQSRTPEWVAQLQSTQQQVDGAVAEYESRRDQLLRLLREAEEILAALRSALVRKLNDPELTRAVADQDEQLGEMRLRLSKVEATLRQLVHQRDLLLARLKSAHAKLHLAGHPSNRFAKRKWVIAVLAVAPLVIAAVIFAPKRRNDSPAAKETPPPDVPLVTEILPAANFVLDLSAPVRSLALEGSNGLLCLVKADSSIEFREAKSGLPLNTVDTKAQDLRDIVVDRDGRYAASIAFDKQKSRLKVWDIRQHSDPLVLSEMDGRIRLLGFAGDPLQLLICRIGADELIRWPLDGQPPMHVAGVVDHDGPVAVDPVGSGLAICRPGEVELVDFSNKMPVHKTIQATATALAFQPHHGTLAIGSADGSITIWDLVRSQPLWRLEGPAKPVAAISIDGSGRRLAASDGEKVRLWDLGLLYLRSIIPVADVTALAFSTDGKELALATKSAKVQTWNSDFPLLEVRFDPWMSRMPQEQQDQIRRNYANALKDFVSLRVTTRSGLVALVQSRTGPVIRDEATGTTVVQFENAKSGLSIAVSNDERLVATGSYNSNTSMGDVRLWDFRTGRQLGEFNGHIHYAWSLAFSHDDAYLLTGGRKTMHLWNVRTQKEIRRFALPAGNVQRVAFSPDDRRATASSSASRHHHESYLFDVATGEPLLKFIGMPPEFIFDSSAAYSDQRFGTVRSAEPTVPTSEGSSN